MVKALILRPKIGIIIGSYWERAILRFQNSNFNQVWRGLSQYKFLLGGPNHLKRNQPTLDKYISILIGF